MKQLHQQEKTNLERILSQNGRGRSHDLMAVLDTFLAAETHQTVEEVQRRLKARGLNFDRVYVQEE